jgi:predicted DsbA family dithiol-disulfide isomerase
VGPGRVVPLRSEEQVKLAYSTIAAALALALASLSAGVAAGSARAVHERHTEGASAPSSLTTAVADVRAELHGIRQSGLLLGARSANVTVVEYADLICPPCATAATSVIVPLIKRFVRAGEVNIQFAPIVESPRSELFALGAFAAGLQGRGWGYTQLDYLLSGVQIDGPSNKPTQLAQALGLNLRRWRSNLTRRRWPAQIEHAEEVALLGQFSAYPVFVVRSTQSLLGIRRIKVLRAPVTLAELTSAIRAGLRFANA